MDTTINTENLDKIISFFERLNPKNFNLRDITDGKIGALQEIAKNPERHFCGTAGCIVGYFPAIFPSDYEWKYWEDSVIDPDVVPIGCDLHDEGVDELFASAVGCSVGLAEWIVYTHTYPEYDDENVPLSVVLERLKQLRSGEVDESNYAEKWQVA